jgi:hypothetical protein
MICAMNGMLSKSMELQFHARFQTEVSAYPRYNHSCQPYGSFGKQQRTILSGTTCVVRVQSGVRSTKMNLTLKHAIAAIDRVRYRATCRRLRSVSNDLCVRGTSSCGDLGAVCLMRIIALVERNVCELAHTNSVFCADAPTTRPAQGGAPRLSTLRWVDDAKGKLLSQVGDQN